MSELFQYDFFIRSLAGAVFAAITCGLTGTYIVSRRMVFVSGGITHASFGGIGIGYFLGINPVMGAAVFGVLVALGMERFSYRDMVRQDSLIAMLWSLGMAVGVIFIYITPGYAPNLLTYLFGSILTITTTDLLLLGGLSLISILIFILFYNTILMVSFDEGFAETRSMPVKGIKSMMIILVALTIVFNIRIVGIIMVLALLTVPQAIANLFTSNYKHMLIYSVLSGMAGTLSGLAASWYLNIPSGATIVFTLVLMFSMAKLIKSVTG